MYTQYLIYMINYVRMIWHVGTSPICFDKSVMIDLAMVLGSHTKPTLFVALGASYELVTMNELAHPPHESMLVMLQ